VGGEEYKERNEIEGLFGNLKMKLSGYVAAYREDMAMVLALVKFLAYNMYVVYFLHIFISSYLVSSRAPPSRAFLEHRHPLAMVLGIYPNSLAFRLTNSIVCRLILPFLLKALETVDTDNPSASAMSLSVILLI